MKSIPTYIRVQLQACLNQLENFKSNWSKTVSSLKELEFTEEEITNILDNAFENDIETLDEVYLTLNYLLDRLMTNKSE